MDVMKEVVNARIRVEIRCDNLNHPCGFDVVERVPGGLQPEHDEIICSLPDGMDAKKRQMATLIASIPEMLERLGDHCEWCADCDWQCNPDCGCRFAQMWKKFDLAGNKPLRD